MDRPRADTMTLMRTTDPRVEATRVLSMRRAASVALFSIKAKLFMCNSPSEYVTLTKQANELEVFVLESEASFWAQFDQMDKQDQMRTVFELFDRDCDGDVNVEELTLGLTKLNVCNHNDFLTEAIGHAVLIVRQYDKQCDNHMNCSEFSLFLEQLHSKLNGTMEQVCELIVAKICFRESGRDIMMESLHHLLTDTEVNNPDHLHEAISEVRLLLLFDIFQADASGTIEFKEVMKHLLRHTSVMDNLQTEVLHMLHRDSERRLEYSHFADLMFNVATAYPEINVTDLCDSMTLSIIRVNHDFQGLFLNAGVFEEAKNMKLEVIASTDTVLQGRLDRLFQLWDLDGNNYLDTEEFVLGMLKFQQSHNVPVTLSESVDAVSAFDQDGDNRLDRKEFGDLLRKFSVACEVVLDELIDFMVIQSALVDTDNKERAHLTLLLSKPTLVTPRDEKSKSTASHFYQQASMIFFMQKKGPEACEQI